MEMFNKDKIAFDIGTYSTTVVVGNSSQNSILIKDAFSFRNPEGLVDDGHILDPDSLKEEIINHLRIGGSKQKMRSLRLPVPKPLCGSWYCRMHRKIKLKRWFLLN